MSSEQPSMYGLAAEFADEATFVEAARRAYEEGYRELDAYSPFPIDGLAETIGFHTTRIPLAVFVGGVIGAAFGYSLQYWIAVIDYPLNVGGKPLHSAPSFIPPTFETTILFAALFAMFGVLALNGLPQPYHPLFNVKRFARASQDLFFLCVEATDPKFDPEATRLFLESLDPDEVYDVPD